MPSLLKGQEKERRYVKYRDQHGRRWGASIELKTGDPTGLIELLNEKPLAVYPPPLVVPQEYLETVPDKPYDLRINYRRWIQDRRTALADWEREARQRGQKMYGERYDANAAPTTEVLEIVGPRPDPVEPVIAAHQGNKYVLGLTTKEDPRLTRFFPKRDRDEDYDFRDVDEDLMDLDEEHDAEAAGNGRRINPRAEKPQLPKAAGKGKGGGKAAPAKPAKGKGGKQPSEDDSVPDFPPPGREGEFAGAGSATA